MAALIRTAALLMTLALTLMACASEGSVHEAPSNDTTTHEVGIAPCTPVEGSALDPCQPGIGPLTGNPNAHRFIPGDNPKPIRRFLEGGSTNSASHIVVRATYLPKTVRCVIKDEDRSADYVGLGVWGTNIRCFINVRTNDYILGTGPNELTVSFGSYFPWTDVALEIEDIRRNLERAYMRGGHGADIVEVVAGGLPGRESILFLGPASDYTIEAWEIFDEWDVQRRDGVVHAIHPERPYWARYGTDEQKAKMELTLPAFTTAVTEANTARKTANNGRARPEADAPMIITSANASDLHQHHVDTGNTAHADGPPETSLPPPCGKAVANQVQNPGLMLDCMALLGLKDTLRGTGTLNWDLDTPIAKWDGVTIEDMRLEDGTLVNRVTRLLLSSKSLTGTIPADLSSLTALLDLRLANNKLTGEIPSELGTLASLETLWLYHNQLLGSIPSELGDLANLRELLGGNNQLTGEIPADLGDLSRLESLAFNHNDLTGSIPSELENLSNLTRLQLFGNDFTGCIPPALKRIARTDVGFYELPDCTS